MGIMKRKLEEKMEQQAVARIQAMITCTIGLIEEITGELSQDQRDGVGSTIFGFWSTQEDKLHPRADGKLWKDIVRHSAK